MKKRLIRQSDEEIEKTVNAYGDMLFKLCFTILKNNSDAQDAVSEALIKFMTFEKSFESEEHKKAWLIRVATNVCRDMLRFYKARSYVNIEEINVYCREEGEAEIVNELLNLPLKYRTAVYLFYIEGYKTAEIAKMLSISPSAVRKRLQHGREMLKIQYGKGELL